MTTQEKLDAACWRLHRAADNLCRMIGIGTAQPSDAEIDNLAAGIDACSVTAMALMGPRVAKAPKAPAAKRRSRK